MKLYVDDIRQLPQYHPDWTLVRTYAEAMKWLATGMVTEISLDHDLGEEKTGYDILVHLEKEAERKRPCPRVIHIHTANPVGRKNMEACRTSIERLLHTCNSCSRFHQEISVCWGKEKVDNPLFPPCQGKAWHSL